MPQGARTDETGAAIAGLQNLVERTAGLPGLDVCLIVLAPLEGAPSPLEGERLSVAASVGLGAEDLRRVDALLDTFEREEGRLGGTFSEALARVLAATSHVVAPVWSGEEEWGVVFAGSRTGRPTSEESGRLVETLGAAVTAAIETATVAAGRAEAREKEIGALHEIMKEISALGSLDRVLELICRRSAELLGVEISYVALADRAQTEIRMDMTHGLSPYWRGRMRMAFGEGIGGMVAQSRRPALVEDYSGFEHKTRQDVRDMVMSEGVKAVVAVPMIVADRVIGVLYAADRRPAQFTERDARLLQGMADQAAIAITNSQLYEQERREVEVHARLSAIVLRDGDFAAIAEALHGLVENPTALYDSHANLLACHPPELAESWPAGPADVTRPVIVASGEDGGRAPLAVAPVWSGEELLGHVHVLQRGRTLDDQDLRVVERAAVVVALRMMRMRVEAEVEQRLRGDILDDLLAEDGETVQSAVRRSQHLGHDAARPHSVLLVELGEEGERPSGSPGSVRAAQGQSRQQFFHHVRRALVAAGVESLANLKGDRVVVLVAAPSERAEAPGLRAGLEQSLRSRLRAHCPGASVRAGLGAVAEGPEDLRRSFDEALACLRAARGRGPGLAFVTYDDLGVLGLLYDPTDPGRLSRFVQSRLGSLVDYDADHRSEMVRTLTAYLDSACNKRETSRVLNVHLSTLKYRLDRIETLLGLDLADPDVRFEAHLATRALAAERRLTRG